MADGDDRAGGLAHADAGDADHVLAEVEHPAPGLGLGEREGREFVQHADRQVGGGLEAPVLHACRDGRPRAVVDRVGAPAVDRLPGVVDLAVHDVRHDDRPVVAAPGIVGHHPLGGPVLVGDLELSAQGGRLAVERAGVEQPRAAGEPARPDDRAEHIASPADLARDVEGLVVHPLAVVGPPRGEPRVAHAFAVEVGLVDAQRRCVQTSPADGLVHRERTAQVGRPGVVQGRRRVLRGLSTHRDTLHAVLDREAFASVVRRVAAQRVARHDRLAGLDGPAHGLGNIDAHGAVFGGVHRAVDNDRRAARPGVHPGGPPVFGREQPHLPPGGLGPRPGLAAAVPRHDLPVALLPGPQRRARVHDADRVVGLDPAGVPEVSVVGAQPLDRQRHEDPVGGLASAPAIGLDDPAQSRAGLVDPDRVGE